ncbi:MAG: hypothetical protein Ct9H300mP1_07620 [Planctomycetaceae bacterium]|nr:MAG: hypothetical protein Ct9H300mP1_07620 [Planctomycetaceae bacterium]
MVPVGRPQTDTQRRAGRPVVRQKKPTFFIVKEKNPRKFFHVTLGPDPDSVPMITEPWKKSRLKSLARRTSRVFIFTGHQQLLVMSHESRNIVQCSLDGRPVSRLSLDARVWQDSKGDSPG